MNKSFSPQEDSEQPIEPPQSIYLEGSLPHDSQILVSDAETKPDGVYNQEANGSSDEPAVCIRIHRKLNAFTHFNRFILQVILSSKMTLSLINRDPVNSSNGHKNGDSEQSDGDEDADDADDVENLH